MKYREREVYLHEFVTPIEVSGHFLSRQKYDKAPRYSFTGGRPRSLLPTVFEDATVLGLF
jgi:hypothetical protein